MTAPGSRIPSFVGRGFRPPAGPIGSWALVVLGGVLSYGIACGKKGPPLPPRPQVPAAPSDWGIRCIGSVCGLWMVPPEQNTDGSRPARIGWVLLVPEETGPPFEPERAVAAWRFEPSDVRLDGGLWWGELTRRLTGCVRLVLLNPRRKAGPPTEAVCLPTPSDGPSPEVRLETTPEGIRLSRAASEAAAVLEVYRVPGEGPPPSRERDWPWAPAAVLEAGRTTWTDRDVRDGQTRLYGVRRQVRREAHVWLASATRTVGPVRYEDVFPPPTPGPPTGFVEDGRLVLVWPSVEAPDLEGYFVYVRPAGSGDWRRLNDRPVRLTRYEVDPSAEPTWRGRVEFAITSVDRKGNESPLGPAWAYEAGKGGP